jgi:hypothetical protein
MSGPVIVKDGDGGSGATMLLAVIVLIVVLALGWYFFLGPGASKTGNPGNDINVDVNIPTAAP